MRISDWSSDVCSSDLNTGWTGGMATMDGISRMPIKATRALLNAALDGSLNDAEFRKDPNFGFEFPVAVPGVDSAILDPRNAWADKAAYRSEEHTSELQSLMRISYAVFCLKKKTKHKQPHHTKNTETK